MMNGKFSAVSAGPDNPKWEQMIAREFPLHHRESDLRSPFMRDYTRLIHCSAFRRLKHKTQVFFSPQSDHICTRIEHVLHVESISATIAHTLGLNEELVRAIAIGHDLGHSPFGHKGEKVLNEIYRRETGKYFWHERNSLFVVDRLELLENHERRRRNLDLTYAVRDGLICHCGEASRNELLPRSENTDLYHFTTPGKALPFTFEGCVVRLADRISYVGRDIEDALSLGILGEVQMRQLSDLCRNYTENEINNTVVISHLIADLCAHSTPETGIGFSERTNEMLLLLGKFNAENIYQAKRVVLADKYFELVIKEIFSLLYSCFDGQRTLRNLQMLCKTYPGLVKSFVDWLSCYWDGERERELENEPIFRLDDREDYCCAVISYIAGMTDKYAMDSYNEIISF